MNHIRYPPPQRVAQKRLLTVLRVKLTFSQWNSATSFFALKLLDKALMLPLTPHRVAQKCSFIILWIILDASRKRSKLHAVPLCHSSATCFESLTILAIIRFSVLVAIDIFPAWHLCHQLAAVPNCTAVTKLHCSFSILCKWYEWTH